MLPRRACLVLVASLLAGCAARAPRSSDAPRFVFQDSFWLNLHHFLRADARRSAHGAATLLARDDLAADERAAWSAALAAYRELAGKSLLFDPELVRLDVALAGTAERAPLPEGALAPQLAAALEQAAPIYRARLWPEQRARNEAWIAATAPLVHAHAADLVAALAAAYRTPWPALPILVDPCCDAGPDLAYTRNEAPPGFGGQTVIVPTDENRGAVAFECVFHEASHVVDEALVRSIEAESARQGLAPPPELWHALLFFTSGWLAERALGEAGTYRADLARGYPAYADALERDWRPHLEGRADFDSALRALVRDAAAAAAADPGAR